MIEDVISRLATEVPGLAGRIHGGAQLADLMARNALPQVTPAAYVLPLGLQGGVAEAATGLFTQMVEEVVGIVLILRTFDQTGGGKLPELQEIVDAILAAILGWGPEEAIGVFRLQRGAMVSMKAGTMVYQIDFALTDQLRIPT